MITDKKLGLKVAENPREELIEKTIKATEETILQTELTLELQRDGLRYLKSIKK